MADITLDSITSGYALGKINVNFDRIEDAVNNDILHVRGGNATMHQHLDMNGFMILNAANVFGEGTDGISQELADLRYVNVAGDAMIGPLAILAPTLGSHPVRYDMFLDALANVGTGSLTGVGAGANITVDNTNPAVPVVNVTGLLSGVTAGYGVTVDNTNPASPVVNANTTVRGKSSPTRAGWNLSESDRDRFDELSVREGDNVLVINILEASDIGDPVHPSVRPTSTPNRVFMYHGRFLGHEDGVSGASLYFVPAEGVELIVPYMGLPQCSERGMTFTLMQSVINPNRWHLFGQVDGVTP